MVRCTRCGGSEVANDGSTIVCTRCGTVLEENAIVSELTWTEDAAGVSAVNGVFINAAGVKSFRKGGPPGLAKEPREVTLENGRKRIAAVAAALKFSPHHVEAAQRLFALAVQLQFIQGRRTNNVVAACLYLVCRRERTPHMLIDFSDILQTNVYVLGHTFLKLCQVLNLSVPIVDPSLYIPRFCAKLEFEDKTQAVSNTALRLVQRMRRDWIQTGRRPSGICGAALLIAARIHGFKRTQKEIINVVRICDVTLRKRLTEFEETPSSKLTREEFDVIDLDEECDPPAFARNRKKEQSGAQSSGAQDESSSQSAGLLSPPSPSPTPTTQTAATPGTAPTPSVGGQEENSDDIEREMETALKSTELQTAETEVVKMIEDARKMPPPPPRTPNANTTNNPNSEDRDPLDFSDIPDDDISAYLHTEEEVKIKQEIWEELNRDYLKALEEREREEAENIAAGKPPTRRKRKKEKKEQPPETPAEATTKMLKKRTGAKFNSEAITKLFTVDKSVFASAKNIKTKAAASSSTSTPSAVTTPAISGVAPTTAKSAATATLETADDVDADEPLSSTFSMGGAMGSSAYYEDDDAGDYYGGADE